LPMAINGLMTRSVQRHPEHRSGFHRVFRISKVPSTRFCKYSELSTSEYPRNCVNLLTVQ